MPDEKVKVFEEFKSQKKREINSARQNFMGPVEMKFGLANASFSLTKWQAGKMTFFASCFVYSGKSFMLFKDVT